MGNQYLAEIYYEIISSKTEHNMKALHETLLQRIANSEQKKTNKLLAQMLKKNPVTFSSKQKLQREIFDKIFTLVNN